LTSAVNRQRSTANEKSTTFIPLILLIETSSPTATVALAGGGSILSAEENPQPKDHAAWLHPAIKRILEQAGAKREELEAVAVSAGPGSYTGLRVGMAAAKGICYALQIPLITVNTLRLMAEAMAPLARKQKALICPMIDARREEVFTAVYSAGMEEILPPQALILDKTSFEQLLVDNLLIFTGSGAEKWKILSSSKNAVFFPQVDVTETFMHMSARYFAEKNWTELTASEPIYLKEFYTHAKI
jgi:tRNA threonylcarbamoyladenosine biosynthesis protein TsaB